MRITNNHEKDGITIMAEIMTLYFIDGDANGIIKCTLGNQIGVAYKIPRTEIERFKDREEHKSSGVYVLLGISDDTEEPIAYIGQAGERKNDGGIYDRIMTHKRDPLKDYWSEVVVFTTNDNSFGSSEISYLENMFCNLARNAKRYTVKNRNTPNDGGIREEQEVALREYIKFAKLVMGTLGHKIFIPLRNKHAANTRTDGETDEIELHLTHTFRNTKFRVDAKCIKTREGFIVLKGSIVSPSVKEDPRLSGTRRRRESSKIKGNILEKDEFFNSPTGAAEFVTGTSCNGWDKWETTDGRKLSELDI